jgi:hypothetical protein
VVFLQHLHNAKASVNDVPRKFSLISATENQLLKTWLNALTYEQIVADKSSTEMEGKKSRALNIKGHLFIFLPLSFRLIQCQDKALSALGASLSNVDIAELLHSYRLLEEQVSRNTFESAAIDMSNI